MLVVLGLIATPNMLVFIVKSFRGDDVLDTIFGYIMVALLVLFWVGIVIELIKSKRSNNKKDWYAHWYPILQDETMRGQMNTIEQYLGEPQGSSFL